MVPARPPPCALLCARPPPDGPRPGQHRGTTPFPAPRTPGTRPLGTGTEPPGAPPARPPGPARPAYRSPGPRSRRGQPAAEPGSANRTATGGGTLRSGGRGEGAGRGSASAAGGDGREGRGGRTPRPRRGPRAPGAATPDARGWGPLCCPRRRPHRPPRSHSRPRAVSGGPAARAAAGSALTSEPPGQRPPATPPLPRAPRPSRPPNPRQPGPHRLVAAAGVGAGATQEGAVVCHKKCFCLIPHVSKRRTENRQKKHLDAFAAN